VHGAAAGRFPHRIDPSAWRSLLADPSRCVDRAEDVRLKRFRSPVRVVAMERPIRARVGDRPRSDRNIEWKVFVRDDTDDPIRRVGSIAAPDLAVASEQATEPFAWYAADL